MSLSSCPSSYNHRGRGSGKGRMEGEAKDGDRAGQRAGAAATPKLQEAGGQTGLGQCLDWEGSCKEGQVSGL